MKAAWLVAGVIAMSCTSSVTPLRSEAPIASPTSTVASPSSTFASVVQRIAWPESASDGWVSPDAQFVVAHLAQGLALYRVISGSGGLALEFVARVDPSAFGGGRWLEHSSGFIFESAAAGAPSPAGGGPNFDLVVLERSGALTRLSSGVVIYTSTFSHLAPDGRSIAIASACCPQRVQIVPREGGPTGDVGEGAPAAWDARGRLLYYGFRDIVAVPSASAAGYRVTVPPVADAPASAVSVESAAPDRSAFLVQIARGRGDPRDQLVLVDGRLLQLPAAGSPIGSWIGAHELLLYHAGDGRFYAFGPLTQGLCPLGATLSEGGSLWGVNGPYLAWSLRGGMNITNVESGDTRHIDLPSGDAGIAFGVTAPGTFVITMRDGLRFVDVPSLFAQPAPLGQLRDRPTVHPLNVPDGLTLPPICRYVRYVDTLVFFGWEVDCGEGRNIHATLATVLQNAGWIPCAGEAAFVVFAKGGRELTVADARGPQEPLQLTDGLLGTRCR